MRNVSESNDGEKDVADSMIEIVGCSLSTILQSENKGQAGWQSSKKMRSTVFEL